MTGQPSMVEDLHAALAAAGAAIEAMEPHARKESVREFLRGQEILPESTTAQDFLIGVFIQAHWANLNTLDAEVHRRCDCVPTLGPAHCHPCGTAAGAEVPWSTASCEEATREREALGKAWGEGYLTRMENHDCQYGWQQSDDVDNPYRTTEAGRAVSDALHVSIKAKGDGR